MELRPAEAKPNCEDWCGASPEVLVKRLIPWRNYSHICYCACRVRVLLNSMENSFSHLLLCLQSACPGLPCCPPQASLGGHGDIPCDFVLPRRADEEMQCCPECCGEEMMQMDFRILTVWPSHHQGCDEESRWMTKGKSF